MDLILTAEEREASSWLGWSDEAIGKAVRAVALVLNENEPPTELLWAQSAGLMLCRWAHELNSTHSTQIYNGVTLSGVDAGNYRITVEHSDEPFPEEEPEAVYERDRLTKVSYRIDDQTVRLPVLQEEPESAEAVFEQLWAHVRERGELEHTDGDSWFWLDFMGAWGVGGSRGLSAVGLGAWRSDCGKLCFELGDEARLRAVAGEVLG